MAYSAIQKAKIKAEILNKVSARLTFADDDLLDELMEQFGVYMNEEYQYVNTRQMKVLVLGALAGKVNDYKLAAKKMSVPEYNIEFESDYEKLHGFDTELLRNSAVYSDVIVGPIPHKMTNTDGYSNAIVQMQDDPTNYPRVIKASANNTLKISINSFKDALSKTRYMQALNG